MSEINTRKPPVNVVKFCYWPMTDEDNNTFGEVRDFGDTLMNYRDTPETASAKLNGCGKVVDSVKRVKGGALTYGVHALDSTDRKNFFGETVDVNGANTTTGKENIPYVACAHAEEKRNGHWNLYKYFKAQFDPNEIGTEQVSDGNMTFSTVTLNGTYMYNNAFDRMRTILLDVDPSTTEGAALIENWFTTVDYIGGTP